MKRLGIIGLGVISKYYLLGLEESRVLELVCVCDTLDNPQTLDVYQDYPFYKDYKQMIDNECLDYVVISTPPDTHFEIAKNCLEKHVSVIIEKPAVLSMINLNKLYEIAKENKVIFEVMYHWQNGSEILKLPEVIKIKDIYKFDIRIQDPYSKDGKTILDSKRKLKGTWIDSGVNVLSMLKLWFPLKKIQLLSKDVIYCEVSNLPIYTKVELLIDNKYKGFITIDWRNGLNDKKTIIYAPNIVIIYNSFQEIRTLDEVIDCSENRERLANHYYNYFKNYNEETNEEMTKDIHKALFAINQKL